MKYIIKELKKLVKSMVAVFCNRLNKYNLKGVIQFGGNLL
ncbi:hypothetical protein CLOSBL3_12209 [Clostridiaceae bacterium BL-3]|nr:hypothetical protein CLOSBL3_12209 [Clostridiaceae bacterium BL-3]